MKTRIVLWGTNEKDEKLLIALSLNAKANKVDLYTIPAAEATEEFYNLMNNQWRSGEEIDFPESHTHEERPLSMGDSLLPENILVERTDVVARAQTEWHFVVLSSKLYQAYRSEVDELKEKIDNAKTFEKEVWEELKSFWSKVQTQINEQNIFRDHGEKLREHSNALFSEMKKLRKSVDEEYKKRSKEFMTKFMENLETIEEKVTSGLSLQPLFNELKNIQQEYRNTPFTKDDRQKVWDRLDKAFKTIKEKKYGPNKAGDNRPSALNRVTRRYEGLMKAIEKMQRSIDRDKRDLSYEDRRIKETGGQLEAQIRQAKVKMIEVRVASKTEKLDDMLKTKVELEAKIEKEKVREEKRAEQEKKKEAAEKVKEKIAAEMKVAASNLDVSAEVLEKAAEEISEGKVKKTAKKIVVPVELPKEKPADEEAPKLDATTEEDLKVEALAEVKNEASKEELKDDGLVDDAPVKEVQKVKAKEEIPIEKLKEVEVKDVVKEEQVVEEVKAEAPKDEATKEKEETLKEDVKEETPVKKASSSEDIISGLSATLGEAIKDMGDTIKAVAVVVGDKIEEALEDFGEEE